MAMSVKKRKLLRDLSEAKAVVQCGQAAAATLAEAYGSLRAVNLGNVCSHN